MKYFYLTILLAYAQICGAQNIFFMQDFKNCPGETDTLIILGDTSYVWFYSSDPANILSTSDTLILSTWNNVLITVASPNDTLEFEYWVNGSQCYCQVYVPNTFTPDGDEFNDRFVPIINCGETHGIRLTVCNRMGKVVFDETSWDWPVWDGRNMTSGEQVSQGMYGWQLSFIREDGGTEHVEGHVFLFK